MRDEGAGRKYIRKKAVMLKILFTEQVATTDAVEACGGTHYTEE